MLDTQDKKTRKAIERAIGAEIREVRERLGLSRARFVRLLPSGIGERTLIAYEHRLRTHTVIRLLEICASLRVSTPDLIQRGLQRAKLHLDHMAIHVDVRALLGELQRPDTKSRKFRSLSQWARNRLKECPQGSIEVTPGGIRELAASQGFTRAELIDYLASFPPDLIPGDEEDLVA